ncbi:hypothetical protein CC78DRAFT_575614 [Lojkania enalia]|uniref:Uncharacterized protein n=1 Tax=Lojkania enalia TaxID=147567 RepID=A0A9P4N9G4_9PLEO|nr:hypothetical protein CC78DRAFT_575614 [Didymosphaeria enalia]
MSLYTTSGTSILYNVESITIYFRRFLLGILFPVENSSNDEIPLVQISPLQQESRSPDENTLVERVDSNSIRDRLKTMSENPTSHEETRICASPTSWINETDQEQPTSKHKPESKKYDLHAIHIAGLSDGVKVRDWAYDKDGKMVNPAKVSVPSHYTEEEKLKGDLITKPHKLQRLVRNSKDQNGPQRFDNRSSVRVMAQTSVEALGRTFWW